MAEKKISYLKRNYNDYREAILNKIQTYYPEVFANINDASIGSWLIDVLCDMGDNLNYHIDNSVQETTLDSASELNSVLDIARTNGLKIPYKKAALVEVEISCQLPLYSQSSDSDGSLSQADENYAPYIKRGTLFSNGNVTFELTHDVDFKQQFDENGYSDRQIYPNRDSNGNITSYTYKKLGLASSCYSRIMKQVITPNNLKPFMEILINDSDVLGVDSIIVKEGTNINTEPNYNEFFVDEENFIDKNGLPAVRFFEVDNLIEQYRFGYEIDKSSKDNLPFGPYENEDSNVKYHNYYNPVWEVSEVLVREGENGEEVIPLRLVTKGKWKRLKHKFITEYTNDWQLKVIFGTGIENSYGNIPNDAKAFTQYQMSRMMANDYLGVLPESECTMFILYRKGGGEITNIAEGTLRYIIGLHIEIDGNCEDGNNANKILNVKNSITVTNTTPSYGGKDAPTTEEIKYMVKYNAATQNRCVTLKDYEAKINQIPAKYGCPFRFSAIEENNKILIYTLGLDHEGHLKNYLSETVAENIKEYLSQYRMINDFVEVRAGKVINISVNVKVYIDKSYDKSYLTKQIIDLVYDYMDVRRHHMGEDIFIGDLQKEISKMDGVTNLVSLRIFNKLGGAYSEDATTQDLVEENSCCVEDYDDYERTITESNEINLKSSDYTLYSEANSMFEIKYKNVDIKVELKVRN